MTAKLISRIEVKALFGLYTYVVPTSGSLENAAILYGDNGVGKSTLLRLVFHLLSAANNRGHRTALYKAEFEFLEVSLTTGIRLTARASNTESSKLLRLEVIDGSKKLAVWDYHPRDEARYSEDVVIWIDPEKNEPQIIRREKVGRNNKNDEEVPRGEGAYLDALKSHVPTLFILNADRRLDSDSVSDPSDEVELRRVMQYGEPKKLTNWLFDLGKLRCRKHLVPLGDGLAKKLCSVQIRAR